GPEAADDRGSLRDGERDLDDPQPGGGERLRGLDRPVAGGGADDGDDPGAQDRLEDAGRAGPPGVTAHRRPRGALPGLVTCARPVHGTAVMEPSWPAGGASPQRRG